jgi:hypothetical protein
MRYMILVKATADSEAGVMPGEDMLKAMADYHEELAKAGVLVDGEGLHPSARGWRIVWENGRKLTMDGPFAETKELVAGYTIIKVKSEAEARDWISKFPNPSRQNGSIEARRMFELDDFVQGESIERFREMEMGGGKKPE